MQIAHWRIGRRLAVSFLGVLVLMVAMAVLSIVALRTLLHETAQVTLTRSQADSASLWAQSTRLNVNRVMALAQSRSDAQVKAHFDPLIAQTTEQINALQKGLEAGLEAPDLKAQLGKVGELRAQYIGVRKQFFEALKSAASPQDAVAAEAMNEEPGLVAAMEQLNGQLLPAASDYMAAQEVLVDMLRKSADEQATHSESKVRQASLWLLGLTAVALALGGAVAYWVTRSITQPLRKAVDFTGEVAQGDLTREIDADGRDEIGELLRSLGGMQRSLRRVIGQIRQSSDSIGVAAAEVAMGNQDLSTRTEQAASNLEQTASSMEQLTATVRQSADAARQANQMAGSASEVAQHGGEVVGRVVSTMQAINQSSQKIADIIGVIDGIAFQTNILALNAAVEAARAGEQGRGFAVVAGEVRTLAQRSAQAAKEIKELITASVDAVQDGSRLVQGAGVTMAEIVSSVQRVTDIIGEITAATAEQSDGIGQVNVAVNQLDQMTQQNAALVEQSTAAAESLREQAARMAEAVAVFRIGEAAVAAPVPRARPVAQAKAAAAAPLSLSRPKTAPATQPLPPKNEAKVARTAAALASPGTEGDWETF
ncbi:MAG TPA: methyl-accepting chemotaxis protein [Macromonas sp.]|nr:methyl-accepting chemotaxis protein [Macromonas sp.]